MGFHYKEIAEGGCFRREAGADDRPDRSEEDCADRRYGQGRESDQEDPPDPAGRVCDARSGHLSDREGQCEQGRRCAEGGLQADREDT